MVDHEKDSVAGSLHVETFGSKYEAVSSKIEQVFNLGIYIIPLSYTVCGLFTDSFSEVCSATCDRITQYHGRRCRKPFSHSRSVDSTSISILSTRSC
jgi:hypothetical protein